MKLKKVVVIFLIIILSCIYLLVFAKENNNVKIEGNINDKIIKNAEKKVEDSIVLYINSQTAYVKGKLIDVDSSSVEVTPLIVDNRTLVPIRFISENFGAKVSWDKNTKSALITLGEKQINIKIDEKQMLVNNEVCEIEVPAKNINSRVYIPLRSLCDVIDKKLFYNKSLIIIGNDEYIFDPEKESAEIDYLISIVNVLPNIKTQEDFSKLLNIQTNTANNIETNEFDTSMNNVQVHGIDKFDIAMLNEEYSYRIKDNQVVINKVNENGIIEDIGVISSLNKDITPIELYVQDEKLIIINKIITDTNVLIYDLSNPKSPNEIRSVELDGEYIEARVIDGILYFVTTQTKTGYDEAGGIKYKDAQFYEDNVNIPYNEMRYFPKSNQSNFMLVGALDINGKNKMHISTYLGVGDIIYLSENSVYVAMVKNHANGEKLTNIYKFNFNNKQLNYVKNIQVQGKLINKLSMDEYEGRLRVATIIGDPSAIDNKNVSKSNIYIYSNNMNFVSSLEGVAPDEQIYSTRFINNTLYMLTYKTTDPLFVINLQNINNPIITGALIIPGYSDYIYDYDTKHIIGFGKDTVEAKNSSKSGFKIGLFDVSDTNKPQKLFEQIIGGKNTDSEILYDYKALTVSEKKDLIAFPVTEFNKDNKLVFQGAYIYKVSTSKGFELVKKISHLTESDYKAAVTTGYELNKEIKRIIFKNDKIYTISPSMVRID